MKKESMKVEGMTCNHCKMRVEKALKAIDGVHDTMVSLQDGCADVSYDPNIVTIDSIKAAVTKIGFKVSN